MAFDPVTFNASSSLVPPVDHVFDSASQTSIFNIEQVHLQIQTTADFASLQVQSNVMVISLVSGRIIRINLDSPHEYMDVDLPKRPNEVDIVRKTFLDPSANHLLVSTVGGENFYLHARSEKAKQLPRLKGVSVDCVAWSPHLPSASTREILIGASDGSVYELFVEPTEEFYRREERYVKQVYRDLLGQAIVGLHVDIIPGQGDLRRVTVVTGRALKQYVGRVSRAAHGDGYAIYTKLFETEVTGIKEFGDVARHSCFSTSPTNGNFDDADPVWSFAWLADPGIYYGPLNFAKTSSLEGPASAKVITKDRFDNSIGYMQGLVSTKYHLLCASEDTIIAFDKIEGKKVFKDSFPTSTRILGLHADSKMGTFWILTTEAIYEITVSDEDRDLWSILLKQKNFELAASFAKSKWQRNVVATALGEFLLKETRYQEAAEVFARTNKPFDEVTLALVESSESNALRKYLLSRSSNMPLSFVMQRMMVATWLVELFASKLNELDDAVSAASNGTVVSDIEIKSSLETVRRDFQDFLKRSRADLDRKTTYDIIGSHGREQELLYYAMCINDYQFVLAYWVQREKWEDAINILKVQTDPISFYKYATVLMANMPSEMVEIWMRQRNLNPRNLIPALLNYNRHTADPICKNEAVRYLLHVINNGNTDAAVHNTLISMYAVSPGEDESLLLQYLQAYSQHPHYDADFALRLCIENNRVQTCVHIYSAMGQYQNAVTLALQHGDVQLASVVADRPENDFALRKKLWLEVASKVISQDASIKSAINCIKRSNLLRIEDVLSFFPDFVVIDDFKDEICSALEDYNRHIDQLKTEMNESATTSQSVLADISNLERRYAIVEPGERCYICKYPLLARQFFVFPCQHSFHGDCLTTHKFRVSNFGKSRRIQDLRSEQGGVIDPGPIGTRATDEREELVASACVLCSDEAVKLIDVPFTSDDATADGWSL